MKAKPRRRRVNRKKRPTKAFKVPQLSPPVLWLATGAAVLMIIVGAALGIQAALNNPENLTINQVDIQGEFKFIKDVELRNSIEQHTQTNLYLLDTEALKADLETQPWIRFVSLRKAWPDQLIIMVEEQRPIAFWGRERLMNKFGELFTADLPSMRGIFPLLYSPEDKGREMGERYIQVRKWLEGLPLELTELTEDESGSWRMKIKDGPEVLIGNTDQERRIQRFKVGFTRDLADKISKIRRLDLRYTNGFAVEWKQTPISSLPTTGISRRS